MNPNLAVFLKRFIITLVILSGIIVGILWLKNNTSINLESIYNSISYIVLGIVLLLFFALIIGVVFREMITNILRRAENIYAIYPDQNPHYIHIVAKHYFSGGENSDGYDQFLHYVIQLSTGKIFLSKKLNNEKVINQSLEQLSSQLKFNLSPVLNEKNEIGYYNPDNTYIQTNIYINAYKLDVISYSSIFDYGFKLTCYNQEGKLVWKRKL